VIESAIKERRMTSASTTVSAPGQWNFRGYISELDGLRAIGLCLVLLDHFALENFPGFLFQLGNAGWIAMDSFFVMSGFLITGILLDSRNKPNFFSTYYSRRALRILPLYYAVLLFWWLILRHANFGRDYQNMVREWCSPIWLVFYLGNLFNYVKLIPRNLMMSPAGVAYGPLWSLQIEEQFYLLFPLAVAWMRKENLRRLLIGAICLSPLLRVVSYLVWPQNIYLPYVELPTHCEGLALGGLIAIRFRSGPWEISKKALSIWTAILLSAACVGSLWSTWGTRNQAWGSAWDRVAGYSISSAACGCLILWLVCFRGSSYTRWMRIPPLRYLGKISYGIYLLHPIALWAVYELAKKGILHFHKNDWRYSAYGITLSLVLASLSWYLYERPFLKLKDRISNFRAKASAPVELQST
jgi:peptidoglycan/LPS O-acetylase OafA/YrhL